MTFDQFLAPIGEAHFMANVYGRQPIHIPAPADRRKLTFGWERMNDLFAIAPHWTEGNLKLILNSRAIEPQFYMDDVHTFDGIVRRADPAKIDLFLGMGASLVANSVDLIAPEIKGIGDMLASRFTALTSANIYCSFDGILAFDTHYDTHEVFALQCEGEKIWRIYGNRALDPIDPPENGPDAQARINAARGPLAMEVRMSAGDLLYIPRGFYHDALAQAGASLHVTFAVAPRTGRLIARLLGDAMLGDDAFRAYLPAPDDDGGEGLAGRLDQLADRLSAIVRSPAFAIAVAHEQRKGAVPGHRLALPARTASQYYARTDRQVELRRSPEGMALIVGGRTHPLGGGGDAAAWALSRPAFSARELDVRFAHVPRDMLGGLIATFLSERLIAPYDPQV